MSESGKPKRHLAEAFRWSRDEPVDAFDIAAAALGMAGPVVAGLALGHAPAGFLAALGALTISRAPIKQTGEMLATIAAATLAAAAVGGNGAAIVLVACLAALAGGCSRPLAVATTRFVLFFVIAASSLGAHARTPFVLAVLVGALWAGVLGVALNALAPREPAVGAGEKSAATARQKFIHWRRGLASLRGWQYALRLGACLAVAYALVAVWPDHHFTWVAVTAVILLQRQIEPAPVKITQRALGVALGVGLAALLIGFEPPPALLALGFAALAALRPLLRVKNYLAYSAIMTPLIVLMMDAGQRVGPGLLLDRLEATLIAAALVLAVNRATAAALARRGG